MTLLRFRYAQVAHAGDERIEYLRKHLRKRIYNHQVIAIQRGHANTNHVRDNQVAGRRRACTGNLMHEQTHNVLLHVMQHGLVNGLDVLFLEVRVTLARHVRNHNILQQRAADHANQEVQVLLCEQQHANLSHAHDNLERIRDQVHHVAFLVGHKQRAAIRKKIRHARVQHEAEEVRLNHGDIGAIGAQ